MTITAYWKHPIPSYWKHPISVLYVYYSTALYTLRKISTKNQPNSSGKKKRGSGRGTGGKDHNRGVGSSPGWRRFFSRGLDVSGGGTAAGKYGDERGSVPRDG